MKKIIWVLLDNRMGSVSQAKGVIEALDKEKFEIIEKKVEYNLLSGLPNFLRGRTLLGVAEKSRRLFGGKMPDAVLSTSRRTVPVARYIKKESGEKAKLIQLMHPGNAGLQEFELVFVPEHDKGKKGGDNIVYITGCAHKITEKTLKEAHEKWEKTFSDLKRPLTAVIVGGAIKKKPFSLENADSLGVVLKDFNKNNGGTFLLTTSRRTGEEPQKKILSHIKDVPTYSYLWGDKGENPYMGFLSEADNIIVTGDSVSMCSEAVGTGKNVLIFEGKDWLTPKHHRFVESLYEKELAEPLSKGVKIKKKAGKIFNPAYDIAKKINVTI